MLKKFAIKELAVIAVTALTLLISGTAYSQYAWAMYSHYPYAVEVSPNARAYAPDYVWTVHTNGYINSDYVMLPGSNTDPYYKYMNTSDMYVEETDVPAARATVVSSETVANDRKVVLYRNYVRPSDKVEYSEDVWFTPIDYTPSTTGKTQTWVSPRGYKQHKEKLTPQVPIRDFRADYWKTKYYRDEFHNQASYNKAYGFYNYWNSAASDESDD